MRRGCLLLAPLLVLSGCATTPRTGTSGLISIVFVSPTAEYYYAVSTEMWTALGSTDAQRLQAATGEAFYGPFRFGSVNRLPAGTSFNVIPVCNGGPDLKSMEIHLVERDSQPSIECER